MSPEGQIKVITEDLQRAADRIVSAASTALRLIDNPPFTGDWAIEPLKAALSSILESCAFQDLAGQRLARLSRAISGAPQAHDPLLNGPADSGEGLDQHAADLLFSISPSADV